MTSNRSPYNRIMDDSDTLSLSPQHQPPESFIPRPHKVLKYVDDFLGHEKLSIQAGSLLLSQNKPQRSIRAWESEALFNTVSRRCTHVC